MHNVAVKVDVAALLELVAGERRLGEALEPRAVVLVEAPALPLELVRRQELGIRVGAEVKGEEEHLGVHLRAGACVRGRAVMALG